MSEEREREGVRDASFRKRFESRARIVVGDGIDDRRREAAEETETMMGLAFKQTEKMESDRG